MSYVLDPDELRQLRGPDGSAEFPGAEMVAAVSGTEAGALAPILPRSPQIAGRPDVAPIKLGRLGDR